MALTSQEIASATQTINATKPKCSADEPTPKRMKISSSPITIARTENGANDATFSSVADASAHNERHETVQCDQSEQRPHTDRSSGGSGSASNGDDDSGESTSGTSSAPKRGQIVDRRAQRRAGPYVLGPKLNYSPIDSISMHLARHEETHEYVQLKVRQVFCVWWKLALFRWISDGFYVILEFRFSRFLFWVIFFSSIPNHFCWIVCHRF